MYHDLHFKDVPLADSQRFIIKEKEWKQGHQISGSPAIQVRDVSDLAQNDGRKE